ncbi:hypothetical protein ACFXGI_35900 [Streptomyces sp. NPDC059355]|uniref:hypothetical protein n=1 Tax=Streptomyces sp. NPDC059355 TaxID=3346811 RepID=UPI0036811C4B
MPESSAPTPGLPEPSESPEPPEPSESPEPSGGAPESPDRQADPPAPAEVDPAAERQPAQAAGDSARWRRFLPLGDGNFTATYIIAPVIVAAVGLAIAAGFGWIGDLFEDEKPPLYVSGTRSPLAAVTTVPAPQSSAVSSPPATVTPAQGAPSPMPSAGQAEAEKQGISYQQEYLCPWKAWVVNKPPSAFGSLPVGKDNQPDPALINERTAADPGITHLVIDVQPVDSRPMLVKELRIKILKRSPAPAAATATLVGLQSGQCGEGPATLEAAADLDGTADFATVRVTAGSSLPQELADGRTLHIDLRVRTRACDCVWVPEIVWGQDGKVHRTEFRIDGKDFHTAATTGLQRRAWVMDLNTMAWSERAFDESILK